MSTLARPTERRPWPVALPAGMLLAMTMLLLLAAPSTLAAPVDGRVVGQVTNQSAGGASPAGDPVSLLIFSVARQAQTGERTTTVGPDSRYSFDAVDRDPDLAYYVLAAHQGVSYPTSAPFQLKDAVEQTADVRIYDATTSEQDLRLERVNLLVADVQPGLLQVLQMGTLVNQGDRTFIPQDTGNGALARAVRFGLPRGALDAQFQAGFDDADRLPSVGGVQVAVPLRPGRQDFALSFSLPYSGGSADLTFQVPYAAGAATVYVPRNGPTLQSPALAGQGEGAFGGQTFALYSASNVAPDALLSAELAGLPWAGGTGLSPTQLAIFSLAVVLAVLGGGFLIASLRQGRGARTLAALPSRAAGPAPSSAPAPPDLVDERLQLVVRLAMLDERYEAGELSAEQYAAERSRGKRRLKELGGAAQPA